jgi:hypothetical protein
MFLNYRSRLKSHQKHVEKEWTFFSSRCINSTVAKFYFFLLFTLSFTVNVIYYLIYSYYKLVTKLKFLKLIHLNINLRKFTLQTSFNY